MDIYLKFKMWTEWIIPISVFLITTIGVIIYIAVSVIKTKITNRFFVSHGYERKLFGVPSVGAGAFYGWVRESDDKRVDDRDIRGWSLKQIKDKYK